MSELRAIPSMDGLYAAWEHALSQSLPVFVPAEVYVDDRGWAVMNQMQGVMSEQGQINYSVVYPRVIKAWHRHQKQTDFWLCLSGHLIVGVHRDDGATWRAIVGEKKPGVLVIPPILWHGAATVGEQSASLLYYVTHQYDENEPDEERRPYDSVPSFPWAVQHR